MPGVLPFLPLIAGAVGMISANGQNKSNQKNADNAAASARTNDGAALQQALSQYQGYTQSHPSPYANAAPIMGPQSTYGQSSPHMGGQTLGANGLPPPGGAPQAAPQGQDISSLVQALLAQQQSAMQPGTHDGMVTPGPGPNPSYGQNAAGQFDFNGNSGDPSGATGYYPTLAGAEAAYSQAHPTASRPPSPYAPPNYQIGPNGPGRQRLMDGLS